jgi:mono/diheme cytochrome c family protein
MKGMMALLIASGVLAAQAPGSLAPLSPGGPGPRPLNQLKEFFQAACAGCHGVDGSARGADGRKLKGQDFTDLREMRSKKDAKLALTIRRGIFLGKVMPSFKDQLSEEEAALMVKEIVRKAEKGRVIAPTVDPPR